MPDFRLTARCSALLGALALAGCASSGGGDFHARPSPPLPDQEAIAVLPSVPPVRRPRPVRPPVSPAPVPDEPRIWLYHSVVAQSTLMKLGFDPTSSTRRWELEFRATRTPFKRIASAAEIARLPPDGVLILPSTIALSDPEKDAIRQWRDRGGALLSTWMAATHTPDGDPQGFGFMRDVLDVEVAGTTADEPNDTFMVMSGDSPAAHTLAAGTRVWLERVPRQLPLRLQARQLAARITSWSREYVAGRTSGVIAYSERRMPSGRWSRAAVIGFAEQNWQRADPRQLRAITGDLLGWLLRQPSASVGAWPHPFGSGLLFALKAIDPLGERDLELAEALNRLGGRMTFYVTGTDAAKNAPMIRRLQALGHELGSFGDRFETFERQPREQQALRLTAMRQEFANAGFDSLPGGFAAPQDGYDETTLALLQSLRFDSVLAFSDVTETQLPLFIGSTPPRTVVLPRTLGGPAELALNDPEQGFDNFLAALDVSTRVGALSVVRLPTRALLPPAQRSRLLDAIRDLRGKAWIASAGQIAQWWRDRAHVSVALQREGAGHVLTANVGAALTARQPLTIWLDAPYPDSTVRLRRLEGSGPSPQVAPAADGRLSLAWADPGVGSHRWLLEFERANP